MPDHSSLSLSTHPTWGLACIACCTTSNWTALCTWDRKDSQTNPMKCYETRAKTDFLFVRDQARAKMLLASLNRVVPEMETEAKLLPALPSQVNWLNNLRGRLIQIINSNDEPRRISKVEKLSDGFSHEINCDQYFLFIKRSNSNRQGAKEKPHGVEALRKLLRKRFKTPTVPPLALVRRLMEQIKEEREGAELKKLQRKALDEATKAAEAAANRKVAVLQKQLDRLKKEKVEAEEAAEEAPAVSSPAPEPVQVEQTVETAIEAIKALPEAAPDNQLLRNFVLGLAHLGTTLPLSADAVIHRTETALEILQPGAEEPTCITTPVGETISLAFQTAEGKEVPQPWPLVVGCTVRCGKDGTVIYELD